MRRFKMAVALAAAGLLTPGLAQAQIAGGTGLLSPAIQWFQQNLAMGLMFFGIVGVGLMLIGGHLHWLKAVAVAVGIVIVANAQTIAGFLGVGGG